MKKLTTIVISLIILSGCAGRKFARQGELKRVVNTYGFVPFGIPRDKDGVATLITFDGRREAVVAASNECFQMSELRIDTLKGSIPNYYYNITIRDTLAFEPGKIFGDNVNLNAAFKSSRIKSISVDFSNVFEIRMTRISAEKQIEKLKIDNLTCVRYLLNKKNYLIERVLGADETKIVFKDDKGQAINIDATILKELNIGNKYVRNLDGKSELVFSEPRLIGYRLWQIESESGMMNTKTEINEVSNNEILKIKNN